MSKKIVITGGLGYIGTELCKIYSGISWNNNILVIDNRFVSERVNQLRNWNIDFIQGDILDKELVNKYLKDADIIHHLAGITDVPRLKSESSDDRDDKIKLVAEEGTKNILEVINDKCKIIFPSTHVVYEGAEEVKKDIVWVVMTHHIEYKAAAKLGDEIVIKTYINKSKGAISERIVEMYFEQSDQLLIRSSTKWCLLNKESQRPIRIPKQVIDMFSK